jgi:hypothetical protein
LAALAGVGWANRPEAPASAEARPPVPDAAPVKLDDPADPRLKQDWWGEPVALGRLGKEYSYFQGFSPDGKRMLVHHRRELICSDAATAQVVWKTEAPALHNAAFSPDGKLIATAEWQDGVSLYDAATGKRLGTFVVAGAGGERPGQAGFRPDGILVVHTSSWNYREDKTRLRPDGSPTVTRTMNYSLIAWDPATKKEVRRTHEVLTYEGSHIWQRLMGRGQFMQQRQRFDVNGVTVKQTLRYTDPVTGKATRRSTSTTTTTSTSARTARRCC